MGVETCVLQESKWYASGPLVKLNEAYLASQLKVFHPFSPSLVSERLRGLTVPRHLRVSKETVYFSEK